MKNRLKQHMKNRHSFLGTYFLFRTWDFWVPGIFDHNDIIYLIYDMTICRSTIRSPKPVFFFSCRFFFFLAHGKRDAKTLPAKHLKRSCLSESHGRWVQVIVEHCSDTLIYIYLPLGFSNQSLGKTG